MRGTCSMSWRLVGSAGMREYSHSPMLRVCTRSSSRFEEPVRQAPFDGVVGAPALTMAHW